MIIWSSNLQILKPRSLKVIYIDLIHISKQENITFFLIIRVMPLLTVQNSQLSHNIHSTNIFF